MAGTMERVASTDAATGRRFTGMMAEMNETGDTRVIWDADNEEEVAAAREQFNKLVGSKRFSAFYVKGVTGAQGKRMTEFDPEAEKVILVPPLAGG